MTFDQIPYDLPAGVIHFLVSFGVVIAISLFLGLVVSLLTAGARGPGLMMDIIRRGIGDLFLLSPRRIGAIASLTIKESVRKKALAVVVVFIVVFLLAGFFLRPESTVDDMPAKPIVAFVLTTVRWMCLPVALLLSCWGLPTDIKDRSLHTVVTKPVRRSEVVIGRILGYGAVTTAFLLGMSLIGFVFINRSVPVRSQDQLVSRVPIYGSLSFLDGNGAPADKGINVGDIWDFRSYISGATKSAAIWKFDNLNVNALKGLGALKLENRFEAFRTNKGIIDEPVRYRLTLVNEKKNLRVTNSDLLRHVAEFTEEMQSGSATEGTSLRERPTAVIEIPEKISYVDVNAAGDEGTVKTVDLYDDVFDGNSLTVEVSCRDPEQYLGAARPDLFIRLPDRGFASSYFKSIFSTWLMLMLVCLIGATASTFVKGPVATFLTFSLIILGQVFRPQLNEMLKQFADPEKEVLGGGVLESMYRLVTQMGPTVALPDNPLLTAMQWIDRKVFSLLEILQNVIPNFSYFDTSAYPANGFDVAWSTALLPSLATVLAYILPCILLGYFSLEMRELEAK